jgi:hypothetical protein
VFTFTLARINPESGTGDVLADTRDCEMSELDGGRYVKCAVPCPV